MDMTPDYMIGGGPIGIVLKGAYWHKGIGHRAKFEIDPDNRDAYAALAAIFHSRGSFRVGKEMIFEDGDREVRGHGEAMVVDVSSTDTGEMTFLVLLEHPDDEVHPFHWLDLGAVGGIVMVEIADDETVVNQKAKEIATRRSYRKSFKLSNVAHMLSNADTFHEFLSAKVKRQHWNERKAKAVIYEMCGIDSCSRLDHEPEAAQAFHQKLRLPYLNWMGMN